MNLSKALGMAIPALEHRAVFYENMPDVTREYDEAAELLRQQMHAVDRGPEVKSIDKAIKLVHDWRAEFPTATRSLSPFALAILAKRIEAAIDSPTVAQLAAMAPMLTGGEPTERGGAVR